MKDKMTALVYVVYGPPEKFERIDAIIRHEDSDSNGDAIHLLRHGVIIAEWVPSQVLKIEIVDL